MSTLAVTAWEKAVTQLFIGAIFFAMRSCEYLQTRFAEESKRTHILRLNNIQFKKNGRGLPHTSQNLEEADIVMITFQFQKNDKRDQRVHMFRTSDPLLNPVKAWAHTVQRVLKIPGANTESKVCHFQSTDGRIYCINSEQARRHLRSIVTIMGVEELGVQPEDIGLHSLRSGGAMAMFLSGISTIVIQRVGRWSSEAFLEYIREQVESFTAGVSQSMLRFEHFHHLNSLGSSILPTITSTRLQDVDNEDGPVVVPFQVQFSDLVLTEETSNIRSPREE